jgi:hypothetical protein
MAQEDRTSTKLQTIAIAVARFLRFVSGSLANRFIRLVLEILGERLQIPCFDK